MNEFKHQLSFTVLYAVILLAELIARYLGWQELEYVVKPLLMIVLGIFFYLNVKEAFSSFAKLILLAIFFSWWGDVLLMFVEKKQLFFLLGLSAFLIAHIAYIFAFFKTSRPNRKSHILQHPWLLTPFAAMDLGMLYLLSSTAGDMFLPVVVYTLVITLMGIAAANRYRKVSYSSFKYVFAGAMIFIASDSLIAMNEFLLAEKSNMVGVSIMVLYCLAQYLIVIGALRQIKETK